MNDTRANHTAPDGLSRFQFVPGCANTKPVPAQAELGRTMPHASVAAQDDCIFISSLSSRAKPLLQAVRKH